MVTVQTGKVQRQDLATVVSASGEIRPKTYVNVGANAFGKITHLYVKEGDHVKKGQLLAQLENVQSKADVNANEASLQAAETDALAADAALKTSQADLVRAQADYDRNKLDWDRAQSLYKDGLIAKSDFDSRQERVGDRGRRTGAGAGPGGAGQGAEGFRRPSTSRRTGRT